MRALLARNNRGLALLLELAMHSWRRSAPAHHAVGAVGGDEVGSQTDCGEMIQMSDTHDQAEDRVAVLGTGIMGSAMARNLLAAGLPVTVWAAAAELQRRLPGGDDPKEQPLELLT